MVPVPIPFITSDYSIYANVFYEDTPESLSYAALNPAAAAFYASKSATFSKKSGASKSDAAAVASEDTSNLSPLQTIVPTTSAVIKQKWSKSTPSSPSSSTSSTSVTKDSSNELPEDPRSRLYLSGRSKKYGVPVHWHPFFSAVPEGANSCSFAAIVK
jgi:hypothetical protein